MMMNRIAEKVEAWSSLHHAQQAANRVLEDRVTLLRAQLSEEEKKLQEAKTAAEDLASSRTQDLIPTLTELAHQLVERDELIRKRQECGDLFDFSYVSGEDELIQVYEASTTSFVKDPLQTRYEEAVKHRKQRAQLETVLALSVPAGFVFVPRFKDSFDIYTTVFFDQQTVGYARTLSALLGEIILEQEFDFEERNQDGLLAIQVCGNYDSMLDACKEKRIPEFEQARIEYAVVDMRLKPSALEHTADEDSFIPFRDVTVITGFHYTSLYEYLDVRGGPIASTMQDGRREVSYKSLRAFLESKNGFVVIYAVHDAIERLVQEERDNGVSLSIPACFEEITKLQEEQKLRFISVEGISVIGEPELLRVWNEYRIDKNIRALQADPLVEEVATLFRKPTAYVQKQVYKKKFVMLGEYVTRDSLLAFVDSHRYSAAGDWRPHAIRGDEDE